MFEKLEGENLELVLNMFGALTLKPKYKEVEDHKKNVKHSLKVDTMQLLERIRKCKIKKSRISLLIVQRQERRQELHLNLTKSRSPSYKRGSLGSLTSRMY